MKGGLRWPLGKESSGDRYEVVSVWHTKVKSYKNSLVRLRVRDADRFDFRTSTGEVTREITLKMTGVVTELLVSTVLSETRYCNPVHVYYANPNGVLIIVPLILGCTLY